MTFEQGKRATDLLRADHEKVRKLFAKFDNTAEPSEREDLSANITMELNQHTAVEEQIFYPAVAEALDDHGLVAKSMQEHHEVKLLLDQLQRLTADQDENEFVETMGKIQAAVKEHIGEEENVMFPQMEDSDFDLIALGEKIVKFKDGASVASIERPELRKGA